MEGRLTVCRYSKFFWSDDGLFLLWSEVSQHSFLSGIKVPQAVQVAVVVQTTILDLHHI